MSDDRFAELLGLICERPPLYLGTTSISVLYGWILGWDFCTEFPTKERVFPFGPFSEFVQGELGYFEPALGWRRMILDSCGGDEEAAFWKFVDLYRKFKAI